MSSIGEWIRRIPVWVRVAIVLSVPIAGFGMYLRFAGLPDVFCKSPDELAEMMPGLRLHALPILNIRDAPRYNFIQSMFYSQHGLGDVSFYYLSSSALSALGLPISERWLFAASGVANLCLALAGGALGAQVIGSVGTGWIFAILVLASPYYVFVSRTGWGRLTWTPLLLLLLFLGQWKAMRNRGVIWPAVFIVLAGFISLTDGLVILPILLVSALLIPEGRVADRLRRLARDRIFLWGLAAIAVGVGFGLLVGLEARRRGTGLTLIGYVLFKGSHGSLLPSFEVLAAWARYVDAYFPFRGTWLLISGAFALAAREGFRGRMIGFVAAWWLLASLGLIRYMSWGSDLSWLNAYQLAVPSYLLLAWLISSMAEGGLPVARRLPLAVRGGSAVALLVFFTAPMALQAKTVAFGAAPAYGMTALTTETASGLNNCRTVKAAAFYVRSHERGLPYVFHLSSDVFLGHIGEFYYGLSYGRSLRPEEPNHLLDFGLAQFHRRYAPEAFYRAYSVAQFDYYVSFSDNRDPFAMQAKSRLLSEGAHVVGIIWNDGRVIGQVLSFHDEPPIDLEYRTAAQAWDRTFAHPKTLLQQGLTGSAYHFGYNWKSPE